MVMMVPLIIFFLKVALKLFFTKMEYLQVTHNSNKKIKLTKTMEQGAGFGELALLYNDKRSATIQASEVCETYALDG